MTFEPTHVDYVSSQALHIRHLQHEIRTEIVCEFHTASDERTGPGNEAKTWHVLFLIDHELQTQFFS